MGTRADFYVGRGPNAEWLGSIAYDGYPDGQPKRVIKCTDEASWRAQVAELIASLDDGTKPDDGWPWPWEDSRTTDYAYAFDGGDVHASCFGRDWYDPEKEYTEAEEDARDRSPRVPFPDMTDRQRVTFGKRSGIIVMGGS